MKHKTQTRHITFRLVGDINATLNTVSEFTGWTESFIMRAALHQFLSACQGDLTIAKASQAHFKAAQAAHTLEIRADHARREQNRIMKDLTGK